MADVVVNIRSKGFKQLEGGANKSAKALDRAGKSTTRAGTAMKGASKSSLGLATSFGSTALKAAALVIGFRALTKTFGGALRAQAAQEEAINSLNLALSNQGNLTEGVSKRLQDYASSLQRVTKFGDETILQAQALLAGFGQNEEQLKRTTEVALDFASATGRDLTQAVNLLGKAFVGETGELSRYGIIIDRNIPKSEKFNAVIEQMTERFGGAAQAAVANFSGGLEQFSNAAGDARESLGFFTGQLLDFGAAGGTGIAILNRLGSFFRQDLVLVLGEARALWSEWIAFLLSGLSTLFSAVERLPLIGDKIAPAREAIDAFSAGLRDAAAQFREESNAAALAGAETLTFKNATAAASGVVDGTIPSLAGLSTGFLEAGTAAGDAGEKINVMTGSLKEVDETGDLARRRLILIENGFRTGAESADSFGTAATLAASAIQPVTLESARAAGVIGTDWAGAQTKINDLLSETRGFLNLLGIEADSVFGRIVGWATKMFDSFNALTGLFKTLLGGKGGGGGLLGNIASGLGSLFGKGGPTSAPTGSVGAGLGGPVVGAAGGGLSTIGGAAAAGGKAVIGAITPILAAIPVAGWIALAGIGTALALKKIFGGPSTFEQVGTELGTIFGESMAEGMSESVQFGIVNLFEARGGTIGEAIHLSLGEIFRDALSRGIDIPADFMAEKIGDIFVGVGAGDIAIPEAIKALEDVIPLLIANFDQLGAEGLFQVERIIAAAQNMGVEFEGLAELTRLWKDSLVLGADEALAAFDAMGGSIETFNKRLTRSAVDAERAMRRLGVIMSRIARGLDLNPTQRRFLERSGLPNVGAQHGLAPTVFSSPTTLTVGEGNRPELVSVMPLSGLGGTARAQASPGFRGGDIHVNVNMTPTVAIQGTVIGTDEDRIMRAIVPAMNRGIRQDFDDVAGRLADKLRIMGEFNK